jgi:hypothetical protein
MTASVLRAGLLGIAALLLAATLWAAVAQSAPDASIAVNGAVPRCDHPGIVEADRSGPLPTTGCGYPPDLP